MPFFTKDVIKRENIMVSYCLTKQMVADYNSKPLQGKQIYELYDIIMGTSATLLVKECVEKHENRDIKKVKADKKMVTNNNAGKLEKANT